MKRHFDFIVVGGGSAGCVLASRLTENKNVEVLLIEAGGDDKSLAIHIPAGAVAMVPTSFKNWAYETTPQKGLNGRQGYQPRGKVLGGSSSINAMIYIRGHKDDYNDWQDLGWGWNDVLPYFKKSEHNTVFQDEFHGSQGPLNVGDSRSNHPIANAFIKASIALGYKYCDDFNGIDQEGVGRYQLTQVNGQRCSAAKAYLTPVRSRENLTILTNTSATKLLIKDKKCFGVEVKYKGKFVNITVNNEVLLAAGAFISPQLLMLSGIGANQDLEPFGIEQVHVLPGVGKNLSDHVDYVNAYKANTHKIYGLSLRGCLFFAKEIFNYVFKRQGILSSNFAETGGFLKTNPKLERPDIQYHFVIAVVKDHARNWKKALIHGFSNHTCVLRPQSRGTVKLVSANPFDAPAIDPNFLGEEEDVQTLLKGVRMASEILEHAEMLTFKKESLDREYEMSDEELIAQMRNNSDTIYHPVGTCKMGNDEMAVVCPELKVHGIEGLRVVDASIFPNLVGGNTNAPTMMVAEKAADHIKQDWGI
jgi:choline dehydrogenase-like flavoprotein